MTILRLLCQLLALILGLIGLVIVSIGAVFCRAADGISKAVKL